MSINTSTQAQQDYLRQMQNSLYQSQLGQSLHNPQMPKQDKILQLSTQIAVLTKELEKLTLDDPAQGPTNRELQKFESLRNAWNEYLVVRKLCIGDNNV